MVLVRVSQNSFWILSVVRSRWSMNICFRKHSLWKATISHFVLKVKRQQSGTSSIRRVTYLLEMEWHLAVWTLAIPPVISH